MLVIPKSRFDAELCRRSLLTFVKTFWHIVEPKTSFVSNWHIEAICEHLEAVRRREINKLLINIPPRMLKSTLVSVMFPSWVWIEQPQHRFLCSTYAQNLSIRDAVKMRRIIMSEIYQTMFGHFEFEEDQNTKGKMENDKTGCRISTAVGGIVTGEGGDTLMVDDPHNAREIHSDAKRQAVIDWWRESWSTRVNDENTGARVVIMQRLHEQDLSGYILENDKFEHLCLPMEYVKRVQVTCIGFQDPRTVEGELLFPERMNAEQIESKKKQMGSIGYSGQMQQSPVPAEGNIIKRKDIKYYKLEDKPEKFQRQGLYLDMSFEGEEESDWNVCVHLGKVGPNFYVLGMLRGKWNYPDAMFHVKRYLGNFPKTIKLKIEKKANGHAALAVLKKFRQGVVAYEPEESKEDRLYEVQPTFEAGNVWFPENDPATAEIVKELLFFPKGRHDDCVDVMSMGISDLTTNTDSQFEKIGKRTYG